MTIICKYCKISLKSNKGLDIHMNWCLSKILNEKYNLDINKDELIQIDIFLKYLLLDINPNKIYKKEILENNLIKNINNPKNEIDINILYKTLEYINNINLNKFNMIDRIHIISNILNKSVDLISIIIIANTEILKNNNIFNIN
jgi:hypothetical protein